MLTVCENDKRILHRRIGVLLAHMCTLVILVALLFVILSCEFPEGSFYMYAGYGAGAIICIAIVTVAYSAYSGVAAHER